MNYQTNSRYRKLRHRLSILSASLSFNFLHLSVPYRFVILGEVFVLATFFAPWFAIDAVQSFSLFSRFLRWLGVLLLLCALSLAIVTLSHRTKEMVKQKFWIPISDPASVIFFGALQMALILLAMNFMYTLSYFSKDIVYYETPVYALVGSILVCVGWILAFRAQKQEVLSTLYIENSQTTDAQFEEYRNLLEKGPTDKKNMSLPV